MHPILTGQKDGCVQACVVSLLHLPIGEAPHTANSTNWKADLQTFLNRFNLYLFDSTPNSYAPVFHLAVGPANSNGKVCLGYAMVHDPSPPHTGLRKVTNRYFLLPFDPTRPSR
jgi:hypothetical protein